MKSGDDVTWRVSMTGSSRVVCTGSDTWLSACEELLERRKLFERISVLNTPLERRDVVTSPAADLRRELLRQGGVSRPALRRFLSRYFVHDVTPLRRTDSSVAEAVALLDDVTDATVTSRAEVGSCSGM